MAKEVARKLFQKERDGYDQLIDMAVQIDPSLSNEAAELLYSLSRQMSGEKSLSLLKKANTYGGDDIFL